MAGLGGLIGAMGGGAGISNALQVSSPLLLAMAAGLRSGQGAAAGAPLGLAGMMDLKKQRQQEADMAAAKAAYGALGTGTMASGIPAAMGAQNAPAGGVVGGMGRPVSAAAASGGKPDLFAEFQKYGVPDHIAYGALGNFKQESGFNPVAFNKDEGAFGMGQWRGDRLDNLQKFSAANGMDPSDPKAQVAFTVHEWKTTEKGAWDKIAQSRNPAEAAAAIDQHYERSSGQHREARVKSAMELAQGWQGQFGETQVADPAADPQVRQMLGYLAQFGDSPQAAAVKAQLEMRIQQIQAQGQGQGLTDMQAAQLGMQEAGQQPQSMSPEGRYKVVGGALLDLMPEDGGSPRPVFTDQQADPMSTIGKLAADLSAKRISKEQYDLEIARTAPSGFEVITGPDGVQTIRQGVGVGAAGGGLKAPVGYAITPQANGTVEQAPVKGGPGTQLPAELAARVAMADDALKVLPGVIERAKAGDLTGLKDWAKGKIGWGQQGIDQRDISGGSEAITRLLTGAGMPMNEVQREAWMYTPRATDDAPTLTSKLSRLVDKLKAAKEMALQGRGNAVAVDPSTGLGIPNAPAAGTMPPLQDWMTGDPRTWSEDQKRTFDAFYDEHKR